MNSLTALILIACLSNICIGAEFHVNGWDERTLSNSPNLKRIIYTKEFTVKTKTVKTEIFANISTDGITWAQNIEIGEKDKLSQVAFNAVRDGGKTLVKWTVTRNTEYIVSIGRCAEADSTKQPGDEYIEIQNLPSETGKFERYTFIRDANGVFQPATNHGIQLQ